MRESVFGPGEERRRGKAELLAGAAITAGSLLFWFLGPFSIRWAAAFTALPGLLFILLGLSYRLAPSAGRISRRVIAAAFGLAVLFFGVLEGVVLAGSRTEIRQEPDVVVVLGAQVKAWGPSVLLKDRLDAAWSYLEEHPDLPVVVTGGQGPDEPSTEASAMRDYLLEKGLSPERIWLEEEAHNTAQNLRYTAQLLKEKGFSLEQTHLLVVSNGFHLARVRMLSAREGLDISTLAAPSSHLPSRIQSVIREAPALVKSWMLDR